MLFKNWINLATKQSIYINSNLKFLAQFWHNSFNKNLGILYESTKNNKEISRNSLYNRTAESGLNTEKIEKEELKMSRTFKMA